MNLNLTDRLQVRQNVFFVYYCHGRLRQWGENRTIFYVPCGKSEAQLTNWGRDGRVVSVTGLGIQRSWVRIPVSLGVMGSNGICKYLLCLSLSYVTVCVRLLFRFVLTKLRHCGHLELSSCLTLRAKLVLFWLYWRPTCQSFVSCYTAQCCPAWKLVWYVI